MIFLSAFGMLTGCARKGKPVSAKFPGAEPATTQVTPEATRPGEPMLGEGALEGFDEGELPIRQTELARDLLFEQASRELQPVYFDYDSSVLKPAAKTSLERGSVWLKQNPNVNVQIEGHCDERGTNEYNLALGERRALAARRYMVSLGINPDRIFTISYGEERPAVEGHDESAWKYNRRDEFKISF
jgi:peptidoglycan-associated lipoprotein